MSIELMKPTRSSVPIDTASNAAKGIKTPLRPVHMPIAAALKRPLERVGECDSLKPVPMSSNLSDLALWCLLDVGRYHGSFARVEQIDNLLAATWSTSSYGRRLCVAGVSGQRRQFRVPLLVGLDAKLRPQRLALL